MTLNGLVTSAAMTPVALIACMALYNDTMRRNTEVDGAIVLEVTGFGGGDYGDGSNGGGDETCHDTINKA